MLEGDFCFQWSGLEFQESQNSSVRLAPQGRPGWPASKMKQEPGSERVEMSPPLTLLRECLVHDGGSAASGPQKGRGGFLKAG